MPRGRSAIVKLLWSRRHEIGRWGRSLWSELGNPKAISPARLATVGKVLVAVTADRKVSRARELREVRLDGTTVVLRVASGWNRSARLSDRLLEIDGVDQVMTESVSPSRP